MVGTIAGLIILWLLLMVLCICILDDRKRTILRISILERENLTIAKAIVAQTRRVDESQEDAKKAIEIALDCQKGLTSQPEKPKIVAKPKATNWKTFRSAIERANDPQEPA